MKIRTAILLAANRIATRPELFAFHETNIPVDRDTPGCALGWIRFYFQPQKHLRSVKTIAPKRLTSDDAIFYNRMHALVPDDWCHSAAKCAKGLRLYADKYHPLKGAKA